MLAATETIKKKRPARALVKKYTTQVSLKKTKPTTAYTYIPRPKKIKPELMLSKYINNLTGKITKMLSLSSSLDKLRKQPEVKANQKKKSKHFKGREIHN